MPRQRQAVRDRKAKGTRRETHPARAGTALLAGDGPVDERLVHPANLGLRAQFLAALQQRRGNADLRSLLVPRRQPSWPGEDGPEAGLLTAPGAVTIQQRMPAAALARAENEEDEPA
ncbi:MAG: hypothetical protein JW900_04190, partial [Anaerolineae bacterium]|nr:hypothetical protein [Anaerolineae bacterium]